MAQHFAICRDRDGALADFARAITDSIDVIEIVGRGGILGDTSPFVRI